MVNGKLLYEDLSYITNQHRIKWLRIIATGIMSHSSVRLPDSTQQLLPRSLVVAVVQSLSRVQLCDLMGSSSQAPLSFTISRSLLRFMSIMSVMLSNRLILCHPLLLLPLIFPNIRVFSNESTLHIRWPTYWSFSFSPSHEHSGLISFRIDWFDLLAVQETLNSLLQHHSGCTQILAGVS